MPLLIGFTPLVYTLLEARVIQYLSRTRLRILFVNPFSQKRVSCIQQTANISCRQDCDENARLSFLFCFARMCTLFHLGYDIARSLNEEEQLLPEVLKDMGYQTHMVGKWHLGQHERKFTPLGRGFDTYCGNLGGAADNFHHNCEILWNVNRMVLSEEIL